ncbi:MAG: glycosyltransferase family 39 protein [bacterium]|nr:glycosyltransferase family 39 protein [bacterium]
MKAVRPLLPLIVIAAFFRVIALDQPMRYDESLTYLRYAAQPFDVALSQYDEPNNHLFHTLLVGVATRIMGESPAAIRLPAFIAGLLIIPALYIVAAGFYGERAALMAAALAAVSLSLIEFSVNARGYTLITLAFIILLGLAKRLQTDDRTGLWAAYAVTSALGLYSIPVFVYPLGAVSLWLLVTLYRQGERRALRLLKLFITLSAGAALTLVLYLPVIVTEGVSALTGNQFVTQLPANVFYQSIGQIVNEVWTFINRGYEGLISIILAGGVLIYLIFSRRIDAKRLSPVLPTLAWLAVVLFFQRVIPFDRTWIFLIPLYLMIAAAGITFVIRDRVWVTILSIAVIVVVGAAGINAGTVRTSPLTGYAPDARTLAAYASANLRETDRLLAPVPYDEPIRFYMRLNGDYRYDQLVLNPYQVEWVDLLQSVNRRWWVVGIPQTTPESFLTTFELPAPPFEYGFMDVESFPNTAVQALVAPTYPENILFSDNFEDGTALGWNFIGITPAVVRQRGDRALALTAPDWSIVTIDGGSRWTDYALELNVTITEASPQFDDLVLHIRSDYEIGSAAAVFNSREGFVGIGGDVERAWGGLDKQAAFALETGREYAVRLQAVGSAVELWIDDLLILRTTEPLIRRGNFRIVLPPGVSVRLDEIVVRAV